MLVVALAACEAPQLVDQLPAGATARITRERRSFREPFALAVTAARACLPPAAGRQRPLMPTLLRLEGFRFFFYSREGAEPPHVHVEKGGGEAKFWLRPVSPDWAEGMKSQEISRAERIVLSNRERFLGAWDGYFGKAAKR